MLSYEQRLHFTEKGWVLLEGIFDAGQVATYIHALDRVGRFYRPLATSQHTAETRMLDNLPLLDELFVRWLQTETVMEANRQCLGTGIRYHFSAAHIKNAHPERETRRAELLADVDNWGWHRALRPKWGIFPDDHDPKLINATYLNNITFLTETGVGNGCTAVLSGSHKLEGEYADVKDHCTVDTIAAKPGDVLLFTESLLHSGTPILKETKRYTMYYGFTPPWYRCWDLMEMPLEWVELLADEKLRTLFDSHAYIEQEPVVQHM